MSAGHRWRPVLDWWTADVEEGTRESGPILVVRILNASPDWFAALRHLADNEPDSISVRSARMIHGRSDSSGIRFDEAAACFRVPVRRGQEEAVRARLDDLVDRATSLIATLAAEEAGRADERRRLHDDEARRDAQRAADAAAMRDAFRRAAGSR